MTAMILFGSNILRCLPGSGQSSSLLLTHCGALTFTDKAGLSPEDQEELDRRFSILHNLTFNSRMARANKVQVTVTYYEACSDVNSEAYGSQGQYKTITGICLNVDAEVTKTILVDGMRIPMDDILKIESPGDIFRRDWEEP